jgi:hypothetical protein
MSRTTVRADIAKKLILHLGSSFSTLAVAIQEKNYEAEFEIPIEDILAIVADLGIGQPVTGIATVILPYAFDELNRMLNQPLVVIDHGWGGIVPASNSTYDPKTGRFNPKE